MFGHFHNVIFSIMFLKVRLLPSYVFMLIMFTMSAQVSPVFHHFLSIFSLVCHVSSWCTESSISTCFAYISFHNPSDFLTFRQFHNIFEFSSFVTHRHRFSKARRATCRGIKKLFVLFSFLLVLLLIIAQCPIAIVVRKHMFQFSSKFCKWWRR